MGGYIPTAGDSVPLLTFTSSTGAFSAVNVTNLPAGMTASLAYHGTSVSLVFASGAATGIVGAASQSVSTVLGMTSEPSGGSASAKKSGHPVASRALTEAVDHLIQRGGLSARRARGHSARIRAESQLHELARILREA